MDQETSLKKIINFSKSQTNLKKCGYSTSEEQNKKVKIISVTSGKGGVGKTSIVGNLAYAMSSLGKKVLVLDADLGLGNMDVIVGITPKFNLLHVFMGVKKIEEVIIEGPGGILLLPSVSGVEELTNISDEQKLHMLSEFERLDLDIDILLVDTGTGISSNVIYFNTASQHILVIATPDPASITDAYALIKVLSLKYYEKKFNLLVNFASSESEANNVYETISKATEEFLHVSVNYLGFIPRDLNFIISAKKQQLLTEFNPESEASLSIKSLADKINDLSEVSIPKGNIQFFWNRIVNGISAH